jgi:hypothetical protein
VPRQGEAQPLEIISKQGTSQQLSTPGKPKVDIFCAVKVCGWIKNIQPVDVAASIINPEKIGAFHFSGNEVILFHAAK